MERDILKMSFFVPIKYFNSHAHVERDWNIQIVGVRLEISTHTLTWSVTCLFCLLQWVLLISTHTLTWSVT